MDTVAFQKVSTSAAHITKSVVEGQAEIFEIYAKNSEGMPISSFFSAAATMQRAALQGLDDLSDSLRAAPAKAKAGKAAAASKVKKTSAKVIPLAVKSDLSAENSDPSVENDDLTVISGIGPSTMNKLQAHGIGSISDLAKTSVTDLTSIVEMEKIRMSKNTPADWIADAKRLLKPANTK